MLVDTTLNNDYNSLISIPGGQGLYYPPEVVYQPGPSSQRPEFCSQPAVYGPPVLAEFFKPASGSNQGSTPHNFEAYQQVYDPPPVYDYHQYGYHPQSGTAHPTAALQHKEHGYHPEYAHRQESSYQPEYAHYPGYTHEQTVSAAYPWKAEYIVEPGAKFNKLCSTGIFCSNSSFSLTFWSNI